MVLRQESTEHHTNNEAEWLAVHAALKYARRRSAESVIIYSDSQLVVNVFSGKWNARDERMQDFAAQAMKLARKFSTCEILWVPRRVMVRILGH